MKDLDLALKEAMNIEGAIAVALVDYNSGMALGALGGSKELDINVAAAANTDVVRAKIRAMELLKLNEEIEDILITLGEQYHIICPLKSRSGKGIFFYLALNKNNSNLALARHRLRAIQNDLDI